MRQDNWNPEPLKIAVITVSSRRTEADDSSGDLIRSMVTDAGHQVVGSAIKHGDQQQMQDFLANWINDPAIDIIISNGGTGITDMMPEALKPLLDKEIPGFAQLFQTISYEDIGSSGMLSRAMAGLANGTLVFLMPGSNAGTRLTMENLVIPQLNEQTKPCALVGLI
ncbi:MAG: molybdenum cofactor biosynthesis protein [Immundisolibacteraceae bacterium]|nr:molybdenum cofactor biosynthesis protein [Immundisolibacteraceae bacterium]